jgi:hypothetical protein
MVEAAHGPRFILEPAQECLLRSDPRVQELHRHRPPELQALALVDDAHGARRQLGDDAVPPLQHAPHARVRD